MSILQATNLYSYYGKSPVIQDVSFNMEEGEIVSVLGRNGVGKTTLLKTIMGLTDNATGGLMFNGQDILNKRTSERAKLGIGYIPQGREVIPRFTVRENIVMGTYARTDGNRNIPEYLFEMFPILRDFLNRRGGDLSGGQQQQLAIARALAMDPEILILDEPTEGIQPNVVKEIEEAIVHLNRDRGISIIIVEQNIPFARKASDRFVVMDKGKIVVTGMKEELTDDVVERHLTF
ncbi:high-affinity branched-chain amino acid transport ATP-binding protein [Octadecabacter arcticus 238]|uniref:High-affinity branched-chain amino acid transport ATP-binding protein n=1 Tax=Octadecabacter arcticus 238 TaxID=391616 RepID=M9RQW4_9RHOB|nr:urea ABC transporter ATP-binding subunit UrtE [Octadecabacter arcticus]AGI74577.1 high-affinity branched-chain amino acid transport ATP-binding protein [Octadecabacter arcticus 238]